MTILSMASGIFFAVLALLPVCFVGMAMLRQLADSKVWKDYPFVPLLGAALLVGLAVVLPMYLLAVAILDFPLLFILSFAAAAIYGAVRGVSGSWSTGELMYSGAILALFVLLVLLHQSIGVGHVETHAPIAEAIAMGHFPVVNASEPRTQGLNAVALAQELAAYSRTLHFPVARSALDKVLMPYHYLHPILLSLLRFLTFERVAYPLLQLAELAILKVAICCVVTLLVFSVTRTYSVAAVAGVFVLTAGSYNVLAGFCSWLAASPGSITASLYRLTYGHGISFGHPLSLVQNPDIVIDLAILGLVIWFLFISQHLRRWPTALLAGLLTSCMAFGSGFVLVFGASLISCYAVLTRLPASLALRWPGLLTSVLVSLGMAAAIPLAVAGYNYVIPATYVLEAKGVPALTRWINSHSPFTVAYPLDEVASWLLLFTETGPLFLVFPCALVFVLDRQVALFSRSMLLACMPIAVISTVYLIGSGFFQYPDWNTTRFLNVAWFGVALVDVLFWASILQKCRAVTLSGGITTAAFVVAVLSFCLFLYGLSEYPLQITLSY